jgi:hypothetical protein
LTRVDMGGEDAKRSLNDATMRSATNQPASLSPGTDGSVLLLSMRRVADLVGYVPLYEFEDVIVELLGADLACVLNLERMETTRKLFRLAGVLTHSRTIADFVRRRGPSLPLAKRYDLFLAVFNHPHELFALNSLTDWRERSRFAACYLCEAWDGRLPPYLIGLLRDFDHVFVGVNASVEMVSRMCGRPCSYVPMAVDALGFCPYPAQAQRFIDVCGIGRRSPTTHASLIDLAEKKGLFYYYDTLQTRAPPGSTANITFRVGNPREHRMLLANLLKRSRYFIANRAWADQPALTRGKDEIAVRFYEGAGSGAVMLGEPPDSEDFRSQFDWEDSVVRTPFHAPGIADTIAELEADTERVSRIRKNSVVNCLLRHDWVHRLRRILAIAEVAPTQRLLARESRLTRMADEIRLAGDAGLGRGSRPG